MGKIGAIFLALITLFLLIGPFREPITDGIQGWRTSTEIEYPPILAGNVVGGTANVTLGHDLYQAALSKVSSVTSNITGSTQIGRVSYIEATKVLLLGGLGASDQTFTVEYYAETDDTVMRLIGPFLGFLIFGGLSALIISTMFKKGRR